ncbi:MAG TPA: sigma-54-dependent Fis family transcriptional regulator [Rhodanobacteraceae bacterium]|jgi:transcriptional regulator of acetoin/glycerol metabolism|nr:sigma-54-dependent Fis family transcriptional regulator [Rhodanobacteraceae bacterium]
MSETQLDTSHASQVMRTVRSGSGIISVAPRIGRSWSRCVNEFGIRPHSRRDTTVLPARRLRECQQQFGGVLTVASCEMENLYELIAGTGYAVILSDASGTVLNAITDPALKREFRQSGLWLGALWDERHEGTNGIGTCLAEGSATTVHRDEHFRDYNVRLSCSSAPILDAHGTLLGVLDASSINSADTREIQRHTMALVSMSAILISRCRFMAEYPDAWIVRFHSRPEFVGLLHEALIAVDGEGVVQAVNESALLQLGYGSRAALVGHPIEELFRFAADTMRQRAAHAASTIWPIRDLARGRRFYALVRPPQTGQIHADALPASKESRSSAGSPLQGHVTGDARMRRNIAMGHQLFAKQVPILLHGATGTGKDVFARALHAGSLWSDRPFVTVSCAAIPENLIESELFGYRPGAFTGAAREGRTGKILQSSGGTLFLDEIGDMPLTLQARLLRAIEAREVAPVGSDQTIAVDLHVISASHRDLRQMIGTREFREDLYYRLAGTTLELPSLADRSDKAELIRALLREEFGDEEPIDIAADAFEKLLNYRWPGNIRQLRNALRTAAALCSNNCIRLSNLPQEIVDPLDPAAATPPSAAYVRTSEPPASSLEGAERAALVRTLEKQGWNVSQTARALDISRNTLYRKLHKHGIAVPRGR